MVYDGGGITPDVPVEKNSYASIATSLENKNLIFDYANKYFAEHEKISPAKSFKLTEDEYQQFVKWLSDKEYDYTTQVEKSLEDLVDHAKKEKYYEDIQEQVKSLKVRISHNKESDLQKFKPELKELLEQEVASRYYLQKGIVEASFDDDNDVQAALKVFKDMDQYNRLLKGK